MLLGFLLDMAMLFVLAAITIWGVRAGHIRKADPKDTSQPGSGH